MASDAETFPKVSTLPTEPPSWQLQLASPGLLGGGGGGASPGLLGGGGGRDSESRSANGSSDEVIGRAAACVFFLVGGGASSFSRPREEEEAVRDSEGVRSDPLPDARRARREGGLRAAPRDLDCR